jgi:hypothetical protein
VLRKVLLLGLSVLLLFTLVSIAQPKVRKNNVTLYLSNGEVLSGLLIEIKFDNSPDRRVIVIWSSSRGYVRYYAEDVEALTSNYPRNWVERDLNRLQWKQRKTDYTVVVNRKTRKKIKYLDGIVANYKNQKGEYGIMRNPKYFFKDIGAIYFYDSNHAHFTTIPNPLAKRPTLTVGSGVSNSPFNRPPSQIINYPNSLDLTKVMRVERGERYYFQLDNVAASPPYASKNVSRRGRIVPKIGIIGSGKLNKIPLATANSLFKGFIAPVHAPGLKVPAQNRLFAIPNSGEITIKDYGALYITLDRSNPAANRRSFVIKIWKL